MKIVTYPEKVLQNRTKDIGKIDKKVRDLIPKMWKGLEESKGVGLAAPQIGVNLNIAVIGFDPTPEQLEKDPSLKPIPHMVLINPKVTWSQKGEKIEKEACLSVPQKEVMVPRPSKIHLEFLDESGKRRKLKAKGLMARVIQHELDHLNGKLIVNYEK